MGLLYYSKRFEKSWNLSLKGRKVTFGFWMNTVADQVVEESRSKAGKDDKMQQYEYRPLEDPESIRVLELAPGKYNDPLRGRLLHIARVSSPGEGDSPRWSKGYEALSYTWGPQTSEESPRITIDEYYSLPIQPSLDAALRHLRSLGSPRTMWVDSICINQYDLMERSAQVQLMLQIYANADQVNIWLGPAHEDTASGMCVLKYLAESTFDQPAPWTRTSSSSFLLGLGTLLQKAWFQRIWVVQEAAVSQKAIMMCGEDSFQWTNDPVQLRKFIRRIKYAAISPQWEAAGLSDVNLGMFLQVLNLQMQHIERQLGPAFVSYPLDILDIAFEMRHRQATDRRDKLFAIMGLVDQQNGSTFTPDYSLDVETTFQRLLNSIEI